MKKNSLKNKLVGTLVAIILGGVGYGTTTGSLDNVLGKFGVALPQEVKIFDKEKQVVNVDDLNKPEDTNYTLNNASFKPQVKQVGLRGDSKFSKEDNKVSDSKITYKIVNNPNNYTSSKILGDDLDPKGDFLKAPVINYKGNILEVPMYDGKNRVVVVNNNKTDFTMDELNSTDTYKRISPQDNVLDTTNPKKNANNGKKLGRTLSNEVVINREVLPQESRGGLKTEPTGWRQKMVNKKATYDRGHVIAYSLSGEDDNPLNLTTQTSNINKGKGIFSFTNYEDIVRYTVLDGNTVRYRVVPMYYEDELVPRAFQLEAKTVALAGNKYNGNVTDEVSKRKIKDDAQDIEFNVVLYNVQDGVTIDYKTGEVTPN